VADNTSGVPDPLAHEAGGAEQGAGALPPQADVVSMADAVAKRNMRAAAEQGPAASTSPPPSEDANSRAAGKGANKATPKKPEKTIDWGKYNRLLESFALIYGTDTVWDGGNRLIMKIANMAHAHGSDVVKMWKGAETRRTIMPADVVFDPTETCDTKASVNLFGGIDLEPAAGDVEPILQLIKFLCSRASPDADECSNIEHWLLCWLAYPLQHLGTKLRTAVIMHGDEGAGKNFLFDLWVEIYGKYGALVGQDELEDKFNDWRSAKLAVVGDEVSSRQELVHNKNRLKALITSTTVQINPKNLPRREERNHINVAFLSNELQPLALDNSDRRYLVIYTPRAREFEFYRKLKAWKEAGGLPAFYHYLLTYPLEEFDPFAPAPVTQAKLDLIDLNRKTPERFWLEWANGELDLPYWTCSSGQLYKAYGKYAQRVGDRFPLQQSVFTRMVMRISESMGHTLDPPRPPIKEFMAKVRDEDTVRKTTRLLLVRPKPDGITDTAFASECVTAFAGPLRDYLGVFESRSPDSGKSSGKEGDS
jgi:putative DNA primase/helicase